ncbi:M23 family metallopeptidase [Mangrovicella endophytica]|uniref:M23 family metallopeptidase n=1 Tax=Mangrovicella endophytica TaxID=2066697 RepID=UPI0013000E11|nr:M23 family metallopeptidase [Mangrovicella endophytica]
MRNNVLKLGRLRLVRSAAILSLTGIVAGCSSDVARFDDGFYTGAVPKAPIQSVSNQPYPGDVDQVNTGSVRSGGFGMPGVNAGQGGAMRQQPAYGSQQPYGNQQSYGGYGASDSYPVSGQAPSGNVQRSMLPPPPPANGARTAYAEPSRPMMTAQASVPSYGSDIAPAAASHTAKSYGEPGTPQTRGAPPSSLQEQASRLPKPSASPRPTRVASIDRKPAMPAPVATTAPAVAQAPAAAAPGAAATPPVAAAAAPAQPKPYEPPHKEEVKEPTKVASIAPSAPATTIGKVDSDEEADAPAGTGISQFRWPVKGRVVKRFGDKAGTRRNEGLNISVPRGTPVKAAENGVVIYAGDGLKEFGNTVLVKHDNGLVTVYGHADAINVKRGATVKRGQEIATAGMSGDTDVPIVHFEVRKNSAPVDPMTYLQ